MNRAALIATASALTAALTLALSLAGAGATLLALSSALLGAGWLYGWRRALLPAIDLALAGMIGLAAMAALLGASAWLTLAASGAALLAWDVMRLDLQLRAFTRVEDQAGIEQNHLRRVLLTIAGGLGLGMLALLLRTQFSFTAITALAVVTVLVIGRAIWAFNSSR